MFTNNTKIVTRQLLKLFGKYLIFDIVTSNNEWFTENIFYDSFTYQNNCYEKILKILLSTD